MQISEINEVTKILQTAISPVVLVSGVGLLVLSMTNRFARTTDRARALAREIEEKNIATDDVNNLKAQIGILYKRSKILMFSISFAIASIFFVSLLIIALFSASLLGLHINIIITIFFVLSLISLTISLILFIKEISLSLKALKLEINELL